MAKPTDVKKILVRAPNWIGDAVMCLPALWALKKAYPGAQVTVLAKGRVLPVFKASLTADNVIEYESSGKHKGIIGRIKLSQRIRALHFDLAVLFQNAFDAAFVSFISGIPQRAGYARDFRRLLLTVPVAVTDEIKKKHEVFYYLNIINALEGKGRALPPTPPVPQLNLKKDIVAQAKAILSEHGLDKKPIIGVAPGASYGPSKRWAPEKFAETLARLSRESGFSIVILGGGDDKDACAKVASLIGPSALNLAGKTTLDVAMALLGVFKVFVTNDSGLMHAASALGTPTVAIFGSTDAAKTGPLGKNNRVVSKKTPCAPCFERECRYRHYMCLNSISTDDVYITAVELLKKTKGRF
ncbi:lipopolysaccharide heptosyltransferase II [bacterium]|nr:MAG: lipopolysaccharide heptosyltransferase II [bacterium]